MSGDCETCQGNGEIVTDWERYLRSYPGDVGDEAVADCPDCYGTGEIQSDTPQASSMPSPELQRVLSDTLAKSTPTKDHTHG